MPVWADSQVYRNYDKSMVDWVRQNRFKDKPILCVFATPERAFAQMTKVIKERGPGKRDVTRMENPIEYLDAGGRAQTKPDRPPLAFISLGRVSALIDMTRYVRAYFKRRYFNEVRTKFVGMKRPLPMTLMYQVDIWGRDLVDVDDLVNQHLLRLEAVGFYLTVDHPYPMGEKIVWSRLEGGVVDKSNYEPGVGQRMLRKTLTFQVDGWLAYPAEEYGIVEAIDVTVDRTEDEVSSEELLDSFTVD